MSSYIGITIGPIYETIMSVSSPAGLWCASGIFSTITESLCKRIKCFDSDAQIISPMYNKSVSDPYVYDIQRDGIGRYHDRIFFTSDMEAGELKKALDEDFIPGVKNEIANGISSSLESVKSYSEEETRTFIKNYICISYVIAGEEIACKNDSNCILNLSPYLDSLELCKTFSKEQAKNPMLKLFDGTYEGKNAYIKNCFIAPKKNENAFQLLTYDPQLKYTVRTVKDIANPRNIQDGLKKRNYFAVVQADGDNMGRVLKNLTENSLVTEFSKACLAYTTAAADLIGKCGGLTIYAGGDDLLFLAPVESVDNTVFGLCRDISKKFDDCFADIYAKAEIKFKKKNITGCDKLTKPGVSFGISVNYLKYPLYEALSDAAVLLFDVAKTVKNNSKNQIAFNLQKGSGQTFHLSLDNNDSEAGVLFNLQQLISEGQDAETNNDILHSLIYKLDLFKPVIKECLRENLNKDEKVRITKLSVLFNNLYDNKDQKKYANYILKAVKILDIVYSNVCAEENTVKTDTDEEKTYELPTREDLAIKGMEYILRTAKFFVEKEGE